MRLLIPRQSGCGHWLIEATCEVYHQRTSGCRCLSAARHDADLVCVPVCLSARWAGNGGDPDSVLGGCYFFPWKSSLPAPG